MRPTLPVLALLGIFLSLTSPLTAQTSPSGAGEGIGDHDDGFHGPTSPGGGVLVNRNRECA